jgi:predicted transcriptional regulator
VTPYRYNDIIKEELNGGVMDRVATTFRIDRAVKERLSKLSKLTHASANQLVNEAIKEFLARRSLEVENELESTLEELRAYRKSDPDFERAIAEFVEAEMTVKHDPAEGRVITEPGRKGSVVRNLLND